MSQAKDFERAWQTKLRGSLEQATDEATGQQVMLGGEQLSDSSDRRQVIAWSRQAMERLAKKVSPAQHQAILSECACSYPQVQLQSICDAYASEKDVDVAIQMLQTQFELFLRNSLQLTEEEIDEVVGYGWGTAGRRHGSQIVVTKIPKSGNLRAYLRESDAERRRQLYCHCPRVRDAIKLGETLPAAYCYCGAGFYQGIWQAILREPVRVELLTSVLQGDDVCTIAVHLPAGTG